jgi:hypothetical protein
MSLHWFNPPVSVRTGKPGITYSCNNVEGAARELMGWNNRGPKWDLAVRASLRNRLSDMEVLFPLGQEPVEVERWRRQNLSHLEYARTAALLPIMGSSCTRTTETRRSRQSAMLFC